MHRYLSILAFLLAMTGCTGDGAQTGYTLMMTTWHPPEKGEEVAPLNRRIKSRKIVNLESESPQDAVEPASLSMDADGSIQGSTGVQQAVDQTMQSMSAWSGWIGAGLIAIGVALLVARFTIAPMVPLIAPVIVGGIGAAVLMLPVIVDRYGMYLLLGVGGAAVVGALEYFGAIDLIERDPDTKERVKK